MRNVHPLSAVIVGRSPSESVPSAEGHCCAGVAILPRREVSHAGKEPCTFCGDERWTEGHFIAGRLVCAVCWAGREPAASMVPNAHEQRSILDWIAPRPRCAP